MDLSSRLKQDIRNGIHQHVYTEGPFTLNDKICAELKQLIYRATWRKIHPAMADAADLVNRNFQQKRTFGSWI